ncbi:MAG: phosphoenolpyruvate--protein phosphotransferase, partial [Calditerrivibrio sp.]|nr:phosphoenolpyruvate--protein phosphotransferase [Calditerrivibrio sp.]MCA1932470.1 phosphoenolpyruvate--protein phosphotransferase [Calditerrivibrio sp.]MCA1981216.1 phosphoenolpyruvate--protein phosphotransferase [Calditerrivibrio sp.]
MKTFKGIAASEGIAIGKAFVYDQNKPKLYKRSISPSRVDQEIERFRNAITKTESYINYTKELSQNSLDSNYSFIFDIYLLFLKDGMLVDETIKLIKENNFSAEYALNKVSKNIMNTFESSSDEYLRERKNDIEHITNKLLLFLDGDGISLSGVEDGSIVIAHDISPSVLVQLLQSNILGFATDMGSKVTHTSIIARAVSLPAVVGLSNITNSIETGDILILDAFEGIVIVNPDRDELQKYTQLKDRYVEYIDILNSDSAIPDLYTEDNVKVDLFLNIEINEELKQNYIDLSNGIGLYRTEFIYLTRGDVSEEEQFQILKDAVLRANGKEVVIRTFDLGGEKLSSLLPHPEEVNPALGLRAIRYSLKFKDFFKKQLRAILRVAFLGNVSIMFPMVGNVHEIINIKDVLNEVKNELQMSSIPFGHTKIGVMVELPSAAIMADKLAEHVDFFSVGTNDLTQYTLGVDRNNEYVSDIFDPINPAIIQLLKNVIDASFKKNISATICGEMAGDPLFIPILIGLGYRNLSMTPTNILKARYVVRHVKVSDCERLVLDVIDAFEL